MEPPPVFGPCTSYSHGDRPAVTLITRTRKHAHTHAHAHAHANAHTLTPSHTLERRYKHTHRRPGTRTDARTRTKPRMHPHIGVLKGTRGTQRYPGTQRSSLVYELHARRRRPWDSACVGDGCDVRTGQRGGWESGARAVTCEPEMGVRVCWRPRPAVRTHAYERTRSPTCSIVERVVEDYAMYLYTAS